MTSLVSFFAHLTPRVIQALESLWFLVLIMTYTNMQVFFFFIEIIKQGCVYLLIQNEVIIEQGYI
jgi:hypothetical protein